MAVLAQLLELAAVGEPVLVEEARAEGDVGLGAVEGGGEVFAVRGRGRGVFGQVRDLAVDGLAKEEFAGRVEGEAEEEDLMGLG